MPSFFVEESLLAEDFKRFFLHFSGDAYLFHTDVGKLGVFKGVFSREVTLEKYFFMFREAFLDKPTFLPTFNYDYCSSRVYDVFTDLCQVGVFNEFLRERYPLQRTETPVFNFLALGNHSFSMSNSVNPFGLSSLWADLSNCESWICFLGAGFDVNTFLHHVEEMCNVGYRYIKSFPGKICKESQCKSVEFHFRVRPIGDVVDYDWERLERDLKEKNLIFEDRMGLGKIKAFRAKKVLAYWSEMIEKDELFLLTEASRKKVRSLRQKYGYPFLFENMEEGR